jgi:hypothetical protein
MRIIVGMMLCGLGVGWYVMAQNTGALPTFVPGQILTADELNQIVEQVDSNTAALSGGSSGTPLQVNCATGGSLAQAVQSVAPGRIIRVSGTCTEQVIVRTDRLTLDGQGTAVLDGGGANGPIGPEYVGVLTVRGARDVTITGLTIQNGSVDGLVATYGSSVTISNVTVQDNVVTGMIISDNTTADITDVTARRNGEQGIYVSEASQVIFRGTITATENGQTLGIGGIGVTNGSTARMHGATLQANNNLGGGIGLGNTATLNITLRSGDGNTIEANNNTRHGFGLFNGSWFHVEGNTTVRAVGNGGNGIWAIGSSGVVTDPSPYGGFATFLLENNAVGLNLDVQGAAFFIGGLTIRNNTTGILASGADTLTVVSIPPNPSSLTGNTTDVDLSFGTRATFDGVTIDTFTCDTTVLSRGSTVCP